MRRAFVNQLMILAVITCGTELSFAQERTQVKFEDVDFHESCFILSLLVETPQYERVKGKPYLDEDLLIDTDSAYQDFQKTSGNARNKVCSRVDFPQVDFSQKTLLGKWASGSCAARGFEKTVIKDDAKKEIVYSVKVLERNMACSGPGLESMNLVAIPKIPKNYKVIFLPAANKNGYQSYSCENGKMIAKDWNGNIVEPRNTPPPGGGVFGVQMDCGGDSMQTMPMEEKKVLIKSGAVNVPPPCPEGTKLEGLFCKKL